MKKFALLFSSIIFISCAPQPTQRNLPNPPPEKEIYLDEDSTEISRNLFLIRWRAKELGLARWDYIKDNIQFAKLSPIQFVKAQVDYEIFISELQKTTKIFPANATLMIMYNFKDDLCSPSSSNHKTKAQIIKRKIFFNPQIREIIRKHENLIVLNIYEKGILLANKPEKSTEYFFSDSNDFLRNTIFKNPTLCGSFAIIKPNGQTLIRNGENSPQGMSIFLEEERWNAFFPKRVAISIFSTPVSLQSNRRNPSWSLSFSHLA